MLANISSASMMPQVCEVESVEEVELVDKSATPDARSSTTSNS